MPMKNKINIIVALLLVSQLNAQKLKTSQDSMRVFYDKLFSVMKKGYLYKDKINWNEIEQNVKGNLTYYDNFDSSLNEVKTIFDFAKADHSAVFYNKAKISGNFKNPSKNDFSTQWQKKYATKPAFEVKVIDNEIGYILMPGFMFEDFSSKNIHNLAQPMYNEISKIKTAQNLKGWIIDLRFNTGGNCQPMLLALYDFLGNNTIWGVLDGNKKKISSVTLSGGNYIDNSKRVSYVNSKGALLDKTKVALITNLATGSSGEVIALAFKEREKTIFIGENTNGKTTSNIVVDLPFGAYMTLTIGLDGDRNGNFYEKIIPDILVSKQDNFDDLMLDKNIQEGVKFIKN